jgi:hypothetical protein
MHIASALRRKRDEIAATIAAYEARMDVARMDLAGSNRPHACSTQRPNATKQLSISLEADWRRPSPGRRAPTMKTPDRSNRLAVGSARLPGASHTSPGGRRENKSQKNFFIWIGRNSFKSPNSEK